MVAVNLTILVELGLFLLFLWLAARLVIRPALKTMDARDEAVAGDLRRADDVRAETEAAAAGRIAAVADARRAAAAKVEGGRREALARRADYIRERRRTNDAEIEALRKEARAAVQAQRGEFDGLAHDLVEPIVARLIGGNRS